MIPLEMEPDAFLIDYTGSPGERTFFLQARGEGIVRTYLLEKAQVAILADKLREVLVLIDQADTVLSTTPERDPALRLESPIEPEWRIGTIGLSYEEDRDRVIVALRPVEEGEEEEEIEEEEAADPYSEEFAARYFLSRPQVRTFVLHTIAVVAEGRPLCQLCGLPMDPKGHICPASNGHRVEV